MNLKISLIAFGLLCVAIIQSAPIEPNENDALSSNMAAIETKKTVQTSVIKPEHKRDVDSKSNEEDANILRYILHKNNMKERPTETDDDVNMNTDDSNVYSDINMDPNEYINLARKRRDIHRNAILNQRNKRSLSLYDLYNNDPLSDSLIGRQLYVRSSPVYIQLPLFDRQERRVSNDYYYVPTKWNPVTEEIEENNEVEIPLELIENGDDDDSDYIRFPTFPEQYNIPYDNLQLQQTYNVDNGPMVDDMNEYIDIYDDDTV